MKQMMIVVEFSVIQFVMLSIPCSAPERGDSMEASSSSSSSSEDAVGVRAGDGDGDLLLRPLGDGDGDLLLRAGGDLRGVLRVEVATMLTNLLGAPT